MPERTQLKLLNLMVRTLGKSWLRMVLLGTVPMPVSSVWRIAAASAAFGANAVGLTGATLILS